MKFSHSVFLSMVTIMTSPKVILKNINQVVQETAMAVVLDKSIDVAVFQTMGLFSIRKEMTYEKDSIDTPKKSEALQLYSKFDFIPGEEILYFNDFSYEYPGELPIGWNTTGSGAVVSLSNIEGNWLQLHQSSIFLTDNTASFTENFTIEFDLLLHDFGNEIINYPAFNFGFLSSGSKKSTDNSLMQLPDENFALVVNSSIINDGNGNSTFQLQSSENGTVYFQTGQKAFPDIEKMISQPVHVAIQVQKERFRIWLASEKVFDVPKAVSLKHQINQLYFEVSDNGYSSEQTGVFITNLKVAIGTPEARHKLLEEGRFETNGILFDTGLASIKPESFGVLKEIADLLKKHSEIKLRIIGHTDAEGDEKSNQNLSEKRSFAVKDFLQKQFGINGDRMETSGKGEEEPISNNNTSAGKAKNRRVEFLIIK